MTPRDLEREAMRVARDHDWDALARLLAKLRDAAEHDHPITTSVLTRDPPRPAPLDPSDPE